MRRRGLNKRIVLVIIAILSAYSLWIQMRPNARYAQVFYKMLENCESGRCPLPEQISLAEKTIHHDPRFSNGYTRMGELLRETGNIDKAQGFHQIALMYDPRNRASLISLGILYFEQGDMDGALKLLDRANAITGASDAMNYYMGRAYERKGDFENARHFYWEAYQWNPENAKAIARLASMEYKCGDQQGFRKYAEQVRLKGEAQLAAELEAFAQKDGQIEFMASEK